MYLTSTKTTLVLIIAAVLTPSSIMAAPAPTTMLESRQQLVYYDTADECAKICSSACWGDSQSTQYHCDVTWAQDRAKNDGGAGDPESPN